MDEGQWKERKTGSVKAALRLLEANAAIKKNQASNPEKPYTRTRELHLAKRDTTQLNERRILAESATDEAKSKLSAAQKTVKDLTRRIEESNVRAKEQVEKLEKLKMARKREAEWNSAKAESEKVMRELDAIKRELSQLKLDMASLSEEKRRAEKETELALSKAESCSSSIEKLSKEIEEVNEEHVLVELARIEAIKEYGETEAQRKEEAEKHVEAKEEIQRRKEQIIREIEDETEMETKLAITVSDVNVLESELKQVREMDKRIEQNEEEKSDSASLLESVMKELEDAKKELATVKDESFQFMGSMDVVRNELRHVTEEIAKHKKKEEKTEMNIQNLNDKLLRAKAKLEATSAAEDKAKSILSNLNLTLEQLKEETEAARKERSLISEETDITKAEVQRTETEIDEGEERLQAALQELKAIKSSEAAALEKLKTVIEKIMRNRASGSRRGPNITISKFEYEYLTGHADGAKEIADKKVAAAEAWIQALKASEKEILMKIELSRREYRELKVEEREDPKPEQSKNANETVENEFENWRSMMEPHKLPPGIALPGKAVNRSIKLTPLRRTKGRSSASPGFRASSRSSSFTVRRRKKGMPNLAQFFSGRSTERNEEHV